MSNGQTYVKENGIWKPCGTSILAKQNGVWKKAKPFAKHEGVWKKCFPEDSNLTCFYYPKSSSYKVYPTRIFYPYIMGEIWNNRGRYACFKIKVDRDIEKRFFLPQGPGETFSGVLSPNIIFVYSYSYTQEFDFLSIYSVFGDVSHLASYNYFGNNPSKGPSFRGSYTTAILAASGYMERFLVYRTLQSESFEPRYVGCFCKSEYSGLTVPGVGFVFSIDVFSSYTEITSIWGRYIMHSNPPVTKHIGEWIDWYDGFETDRNWNVMIANNYDKITVIDRNHPAVFRISEKISIWDSAPSYLPHPLLDRTFFAVFRNGDNIDFYEVQVLNDRILIKGPAKYRVNCPENCQISFAKSGINFRIEKDDHEIVAIKFLTSFEKLGTSAKVIGDVQIGIDVISVSNEVYEYEIVSTQSFGERRDTSGVSRDTTQRTNLIETDFPSDILIC